MGNVFSTSAAPTKTETKTETQIEPLKENDSILPEKRTRKATVLQTFKSFIQPNSNPVIGIEGEEENRTITQYSSFMNPKNDDSRQLTKKKSFTKDDEDIFTILCIGAGGAGNIYSCFNISRKINRNNLHF
jgi:hypothetical protein